MKFIEKAGVWTEVLQLKHLSFLSSWYTTGISPTETCLASESNDEDLMLLEETGETQAPRSSQPCPPEPRPGPVCPWRSRGSPWLHSNRLESLACMARLSGVSWMRKVAVLHSQLPESHGVLPPAAGLQAPTFWSQNQHAEAGCTSSPSPFPERKSIPWSTKLHSLPQQPSNHKMTAQEPGSVVSSPGNVVDSQPGDLWSLCIQPTPLLAVVKETAMLFSFTPRALYEQVLFSKFQFIRYFWATIIIACQVEIPYFIQLWINLNWFKTWRLRTYI